MYTLTYRSQIQSPCTGAVSNRAWRGRGYVLVAVVPDGLEDVRLDVGDVGVSGITELEVPVIRIIHLVHLGSPIDGLVVVVAEGLGPRALRGATRPLDELRRAVGAGLE